MTPNKTIAPSVHEALNNRIAKVSRYLDSNAPHVADEQAHLDAETEEHAYWHYGYMIALRDVQRMLNSGEYI